MERTLIECEVALSAARPSCDEHEANTRALAFKNNERSIRQCFAQLAIGTTRPPRSTPTPDPLHMYLKRPFWGPKLSLNISN